MSDFNKDCLDSIFEQAREHADEPTYIPLTKRQREVLRAGLSALAQAGPDPVDVDSELREIATVLDGRDLERAAPPPTTWAALTTLQVGEQVKFTRRATVTQAIAISLDVIGNATADIIFNDLAGNTACLVLKLHPGSGVTFRPGDPFVYLHAPMRGSSFDESQPPPIELVGKSSHGNAEDRT